MHIAYVLKENASFQALGQLMGVVHKRIYASATVQFLALTPNIKGTNSSIFSIYSTLSTTSGSIFSGCCSQH